MSAFNTPRLLDNLSMQIPLPIIALVQSCMYPHPQHRPTFTEILHQLSGIEKSRLVDYSSVPRGNIAAESCNAIPNQPTMHKVVISTGLSSSENAVSGVSDAPPDQLGSFAPPGSRGQSMMG